MRVPLILKDIESRTEDPSEKEIIVNIIEAEEASLRELDDKMKWLKNFERLLEIQRNIQWPSVIDLDPKIFIPEVKSKYGKDVCKMSHRSISHIGLYLYIYINSYMSLFCFLYSILLYLFPLFSYSNFSIYSFHSLTFILFYTSFQFLKGPLSKQPCEKIIVSPRRQIILEGAMNLLDSGKPVEMYLFLFDDMFVITRRKKGLTKKVRVRSYKNQNRRVEIRTEGSESEQKSRNQNRRVRTEESESEQKSRKTQTESETI